jgi:DNA repair protein RadD
MIELRPYQRSSINALYADWKEGKRAPLIVLPTGAGKSLVIAKLIQELRDAYHDIRILNATHVKELIEQNYAELLKIWPLAPAGIYSAGLRRRDAGAQILFGGIQTIAKRAREIGYVDLVLIDEAHLVPRDAETQYGQLLAGLREINPEVRMAGLTATHFRLGEGYLHEGEGALFDSIAYEASVREMIDAGYLCRPVSKATRTHYDLAGVTKVAGDFNQGKLQAAVDVDNVTAAAVDETVARGEGRRSWLLFCSGVEHAQHVRDAIRSRGISAEMVLGDTPSGERARILSDFKAGRVRAVTNNSVLTTGFNHPGVDLLAMMRPTLSTGLYVQMVGRGLRNAPGKENCLVLDFAGNIARHGPIDDVVVKPPSSGDGEAPIKICPTCDSIVPAAARVCPDCGHQFPEPELKITKKAADAAILTEGSATWYDVTSRYFERHESRTPGKPPTVKVQYFPVDHTAVNEWLCPEHEGYAKRKADRYWRDHGGDTPVPSSVDEWLNRGDELSRTEAIALRQKRDADGKATRYYEVAAYRASMPETTGDLASDLRSSLATRAVGDFLDEEIPF